ncbi:MAG: sugar ABC transporter ATP-binding protein [Acidobacteriaceae bacterium]|jgi:erythritol transport system ATP-binding protein
MSDAFAMGKDVVLESRGVTKRYGATVALNKVTFRVRRGAVNVLIGENGAGKSTLMRLLAGAEQPTSGEIWKDGRRLEMSSPRDATAASIAIVYQDLAVMENLNLAENIFAGRELVRSALLVDRKSEEVRGAAALHELGKPQDMRRVAGDLFLGDRQVLEVARALVCGAQVLILDEPTSALSATEAASLFRVIEELKQRGVAIVYISHRLNELLHLGDFFTVLRDGCVVGEGVRGGVDRRWIVERMSGRDMGENKVDGSSAALANQPPLFEISGLCAGIAGGSAAGGLNLQIQTGEIVGIYGLLGAGRTELLEAIAGLRKIDSGELRIAGKKISVRSVVSALAAGIALVPEDRQRDGLVPELSIRENISLSALGSFARAGWVRRSAEAAGVREVAGQVHIAAHDLELPVTTLSGGNQQKVVLARCLMRKPKVLLLDEPTRGIDVGAKDEIYRTLRALAARGLTVLFATSEIEEAQVLADRVLVLTQGRFVAEFTPSQATDAALFAAACPAMEAAG